MQGYWQPMSCARHTDMPFCGLSFGVCCEEHRPIGSKMRLTVTPLGQRTLKHVCASSSTTVQSPHCQALELEHGQMPVPSHRHQVDSLCHWKASLHQCPFVALVSHSHNLLALVRLYVLHALPTLNSKHPRSADRPV